MLPNHIEETRIYIYCLFPERFSFTWIGESHDYGVLKGGGSKGRGFPNLP